MNESKYGPSLFNAKNQMLNMTKQSQYRNHQLLLLESIKLCCIHFGKFKGDSGFFFDILIPFP